MKTLILFSVLFAILCLSLGFGRSESIGNQDLSEGLDEAGDAFTFVRIQYDTAGGGWGGSRGSFRGGYGRRGPRLTWAVDYPDADENFIRGIRRLSHIHVNKEPIVLRLDDDRIFEHPFLYMLEMGRNGGPLFTDKEIKNLREYLLRGGFLFIDDFWGTWEWDNFYRAFVQVFPHRPIVELDRDHQIFHCFYDIDGPQMIPAIFNIGNYPEQNVDVALNRAVLDDDGRVMVLINWNSDIGDGWEHTYHPAYPTKYANLAYRLGINYLIYAMTH